MRLQNNINAFNHEYWNLLVGYWLFKTYSYYSRLTYRGYIFASNITKLDFSDSNGTQAILTTNCQIVPSWLYKTRFSMYIVPAQRRDPADVHR